MNIELSNIFYRKITPKILIVINLSLIIVVLLTFNSHRNFTDLTNIPSPIIKINEHQVYSGLNAPIFGQFSSEISSNEIIQKSLLQLEIVGIIHSQDNKSSEVIIRMADGTDKTYKLNSKINNQLKIVKILPDSIIVRRNNVLESLHMPKDHLNYYDPKSELLE